MTLFGRWRFLSGRGLRRCERAKSLMKQGRRELLLTSAYLPGQMKWKAGTAVITWMPFPRGLAIWLVDTVGVHTAWVDVPQDRLESAVEIFARLCADPLSDTSLIDKEGRQLYQWMLQPVSELLHGATTLVIEPDERLERYPLSGIEVTSRGIFRGSLLHH